MSDDIMAATADMEEVLARGERPTGKMQYAVQLMIFVDYELYLRWSLLTSLTFGFMIHWTAL